MLANLHPASSSFLRVNDENLMARLLLCQLKRQPRDVTQITAELACSKPARDRGLPFISFNPAGPIVTQRVAPQGNRGFFMRELIAHQSLFIRNTTYDAARYSHFRGAAIALPYEHPG
jgi:hypothetical protein